MTANVQVEEQSKQVQEFWVCLTPPSRTSFLVSIWILKIIFARSRDFLRFFVSKWILKSLLVS